MKAAGLLFVLAVLVLACGGRPRWCRHADEVLAARHVQEVIIRRYGRDMTEYPQWAFTEFAEAADRQVHANNRLWDAAPGEYESWDDIRRRCGQQPSRAPRVGD